MADAVVHDPRVTACQADVEHGRPSPLGFAEEEGDLLECDGDGDPDCEALEHGPRHELDESTEPGQTHDQDQEAGNDGNGRDRTHAVVGHDGHEHDGHGSRRSRHLDGRSTEYRSHDACHDRRHDAGCCAHPRSDTETQGEREGNDANGHPCQQIAPPRAI